MNSSNGFGSPVRNYKRPTQPNKLRTAAILIMTAVIIAFVVIFIMSLTGTGMFGDKKDDPIPEIDSPDTKETEENVTDAPSTETPDTSDTDEDPTKIKYTFINKTAADMGYGLLQVINSEHLYSFKEESLLDDLYSNRPSLKSYQLSGSSLRLRYDVIKSLNTMMDTFFTETGYKFVNVKTAYRSFDDQKDLHEGNPDTYDMPGATDYHSGATFRFTGYDFEAGSSVNLDHATETKWLKDNMHKYGFVFRSPSDKKDIVGYTTSWQIRYVGIPHAEYMKTHNLCLEEYIDKLASEYSYSNPHLVIEASDGNTYEVYYVASVVEGTLRLPVPENRPYTVSDTNLGGFIVTVTVSEGSAA